MLQALQEMEESENLKHSVQKRQTAGIHYKHSEICFLLYVLYQDICHTFHKTTFIDSVDSNSVDLLQHVISV